MIRPGGGPGDPLYHCIGIAVRIKAVNTRGTVSGRAGESRSYKAVSMQTIVSSQVVLTAWEFANVVGHSDKHTGSFHMISIFNMNLK